MMAGWPSPGTAGAADGRLIGNALDETASVGFSATLNAGATGDDIT